MKQRVYLMQDSKGRYFTEFGNWAINKELAVLFTREQAVALYSMKNSIFTNFEEVKD